jgi:hypothetical protein
MYLVSLLAGSVVKIVQSVEPDYVYQKNSRVVVGENEYQVTLLVYVEWSKMYYAFLKPMKVGNIVPMGTTEKDYQRFVNSICDLY